MKLSNSLITSIACYRRHFEFQAVWSQLRIFLRDMSPREVPYPDAASELLYRIIREPDLVRVANKRIVVQDVADSPFVLNDAATLELPALGRERLEDRIRMVALFELAGRRMNEADLGKEVLTLDGAREVVLENGYSLKVVEQDYQGEELTLRPIRVASTSGCASVVDGVEIQPGKFAYGVFSALGLHRVLPPMVQNETYRLRVSRNGAGTVETLVRNKLNGTRGHMPNVRSFCIIGKDNYAYVENNMVYCHHNEALAKRIRDEIGFLDCPLFVRWDDGRMVITMKNGNEKSIGIR